MKQNKSNNSINKQKITNLTKQIFATSNLKKENKDETNNLDRNIEIYKKLMNGKSTYKLIISIL